MPSRLKQRPIVGTLLPIKPDNLFITLNIPEGPANTGGFPKVQHAFQERIEGILVRIDLSRGQEGKEAQTNNRKESNRQEFEMSEGMGHGCTMLLVIR
jgi:hypothetical protein